MNEGEYSLFLSGGAWVCAAGALLNLAKLKKRGNTAFVLSVAFLVLGAILLMIKNHLPDAYISLAGVLLIGLLVLDVILRNRQQERHP